ncbi:MAG: hypothetical protein HY927_14200 [Elusimicrobia bacterium]|nr:hypothetical protein [Elusimicrobiota bacterium]
MRIRWTKKVAGLSARLWAVLALVCLALAGTCFVLLRRIEPRLSLSYQRLAARERRAEAIKGEITRLAGRHPWAGAYYLGDGLGLNQSLLVAPEAGWHFAWHGCIGGTHAEEGRVREAGSKLVLEGSRDRKLSQGLVVVPWSGRVYLVEEDELPRFANAVNSGEEPRYEGRGFFFLRDGDDEKVVDSKPGLPLAYGKLLLDRPIDAVILSVGRPLAEPGPAGFDHETTVALSAGRRDGVLSGMEFHVLGRNRSGTATVLHAGERSSLARFARTLMTDPKPEPGWRVSTVHEWNRAKPPWGQALRVQVTRRQERALAPYAEDMERLFSRENLSGAVEQGFKVVPVADIKAEAVDWDLLYGKAFQAWVSSTSASLGANAFVLPYFPERRKGPRGFSVAANAVRVEYAGEFVKPREFPSRISYDSRDERLDWKAGRAVQLLKRNAYSIGEKRIRLEASCRLLKLSPEEHGRFQDLRVEDLSPDQRAALRLYWCRTAERGRVRDLDRTREDFRRWWDALDAESEPGLRALQNKDPRAVSEYYRLLDEAYPRIRRK